MLRSKFSILLVSKMLTYIHSYVPKIISTGISCKHAQIKTNININTHTESHGHTQTQTQRPPYLFFRL